MAPLTTTQKDFLFDAASLGTNLLLGGLFKPKKVTGININPRLQFESQIKQEALTDTIGELKKQQINRAATQKIGELSAHFAHLGSVPMAVQNRYFEKVTEQSRELKQRIELETSWNLYQESTNALQWNYSVQNQCQIELNRIENEKRARKRNKWGIIGNTILSIGKLLF